MEKEEKEKENQRRLLEAQQRDLGEADEASGDEEEEQRPTGIIQPKYKIVHSYPVAVEDAWGGYTTA